MIKDLRTKSDIELGELITKLKVQLVEMRFKAANGENQEAHKAKQIKKTIALSSTVLSERKVRLSYTAYQTRIIKLDKDGKQIFIPIKSMQDSKELVKPVQLEKTVSKTKVNLEKAKDIKTTKLPNVAHDEKNTIYADAIKAKTKKVDMKKKPLQNRKISSKG